MEKKNIIPTPRELKEQRFKELLDQFYEILEMSDEEWEEYNEREDV